MMKPLTMSEEQERADRASVEHYIKLRTICIALAGTDTDAERCLRAWAEIDALRSALAESEARYSEAVEFISTCEDYFDQRADADAVGDPMHYQGNVEMHRLAECRRILSRPEARAVLEGGSRGEDA